jgi:hypothetical protein
MLTALFTAVRIHTSVALLHHGLDGLDVTAE